MSDTKRVWSRKFLVEQLHRARIKYESRRLSDLSDQDWNDLGEALWYEIYPDAPNPRRIKLDVQPYLEKIGGSRED